MTRALAVLAVVEAVVIVALATLLLTRPDTPPAGETARGAASRAASGPDLPTGPGAGPAVGTGAHPPAPEEAPPTETVIHGRVRRDDGESFPWGWVSVVAEDGRSLSTRIDEAGRYAVVGLSPGPHEVHASVPGAIPHREAVEIPAGVEAIRLDVTLRAAVNVGVRLVTPDGRLLGKALVELSSDPRVRWGTGRALGAIATREPPPPRLPPFTQARVRRYGVGEFRADESGQAADGRIGDLAIHGALPVHVSAVLRHVVLGTVRLDEPAETVDIVVDPGHLSDQMGALTLRVRREGDPELEAIWFELSDSQSGGGTKAERDGDRFTIAPALPGRLELDIGGPPGWESIRRIVEIEPGRTLDLGLVEIRRAVALTGRVTDAEGAPVAEAVISWYDPSIPYRDQRPSRIHMETSADGSFRPWGLGPRRYVFRVGMKGRFLQAFEVDLRNGPVEDLVLRVRRGTRLTLVRPRGSEEPARGIVEDARGLVVTRFSVRSGWPRSYHLVPGTYVVAVDGGRRIPVTVGEAPGPPVVVD